MVKSLKYGGGSSIHFTKGFYFFIFKESNDLLYIKRKRSQIAINAWLLNPNYHYIEKRSYTITAVIAFSPISPLPLIFATINHRQKILTGERNTPNWKSSFRIAGSRSRATDQGLRPTNHEPRPRIGSPRPGSYDPKPPINDPRSRMMSSGMLARW